MTVEGQVTATTEDSVTVEDLVLVDDLETVEDQAPAEFGIVALWLGATCCPAWQRVPRWATQTSNINPNFNILTNIDIPEYG